MNLQNETPGLEASAHENKLEDQELQEVLRIRGEEEFGAVELPVPPIPRRPSSLPLVGLATVFLGLMVWSFGRSGMASLSTIGGHTVSVGSVGYGPDLAQAGVVVDPSFKPKGSMPFGLALSTMVGQTIYGCGDRHPEGALPPDGPLAKTVADRVEELLEYVQERPGGGEVQMMRVFDPKLSTKLPSKTFSVSLEWRNGGAAQTVAVPIGNSPEAKRERHRVALNASKLLTDAVADSIDEMHKNQGD